MLNEIPIHLDRLMSKEAVDKLRSVGLEKVAAAMLKEEGYKVGEDVTMYDVVRALGTKLRQKNAEYTRIREGLESLRNSR